MWHLADEKKNETKQSKSNEKVINVNPYRLDFIDRLELFLSCHGHIFVSSFEHFSNLKPVTAAKLMSNI